MKIIKTFRFGRLPAKELVYEVEENIVEEFITPTYIIERLDSEQYSIFTWPSSVLLALYLSSVPELIVDKCVLEIGSGTALPSIVCGRLGAKKVIATDRSEEDDLLQNIRETVEVNELQPIIDVQPFDWGNNFSLPVDLVLGADVFYSSEDFDDILNTVYSILSQEREQSKSKPSFLTAYQLRSTTRSIYSSLQRYSLVGEIIPKSFLSSYHWFQTCSLHSSESHEKQEKKLESFDDIILIKISLQ